MRPFERKKRYTTGPGPSLVALLAGSATLNVMSVELFGAACSDSERRTRIRVTRKPLLWLGGSVLVGAAMVVTMCHTNTSAPSACFGSTGAGALRDGWRLPARGANFSSYSLAGWALGRTYVHSAVHATVLEAYDSLLRTLPERRFVYGETGLARGGKFAPHRTHQNGLSVDFMVPIVTAEGVPTTLPTWPTNEFGYGVDFDASGRSNDIAIDFESLAMHLAALQAATRKHEVGIARVILAPDLQAHLRRTKSWAAIRSLPFSKRPSWVRHDDHYHVDFRLRCAPLAAAQ